MMTLSLILPIGLVITAALASLPQVTQVNTIAGYSQGYADGVGTSARFENLVGVAVDDLTGVTYIVDHVNCAIRAMSLTGSVTTVAGSPPSFGRSCAFLDAAVGTNARFYYPWGICINGGVAYIAEWYNNAVRSVQLNRIDGTYRVATVAGQISSGFLDAVGTLAQFNHPTGVAYHAPTNSLLITDEDNYAVRSIALLDNLVTTVAGTSMSGFVDAVGSVARFSYVMGIAVDPFTGLVYVADEGNSALRVVDVTSRSVTTLAGSYPVATTGFVDGNGTNAQFNYLHSVAFDNATNGLVVIDSYNFALRWVSLSGNVTTIAGKLPPTPVSGFVDGNGTTARFAQAYGVAVLRPSSATRTSTYLVGDTYNSALRSVSFNFSRDEARRDSKTPSMSSSTSMTSGRSTTKSTSHALTATVTPSTSARSRTVTILHGSPSTTWSRSRSPTKSTVASRSRSSTVSSSWRTLDLSRTQDSVSRSTSNAASLSRSPSRTTTITISSAVVPSITYNVPRTVTPSTTCAHPLVEWYSFRYDAINVSTDYLTVALQPSAPPFVAVGVAMTTMWTSLALPLATLQRGSPFVLNLTCAAGVSIRSASVVHSRDESVPLVAAELVPQSSDATPPRFRLLKLSLPPNTNWIQPRAAAVTLSLVFSGCDNRTATAATIFVGLLPVPLMAQIPIVSSVVGSTTAVVSMTTATTAARVGAVRTLLLCMTTGASTGGLLGLSIARPEVDGDDNEVLPSARGAVVGNMVAVCVAGVVLCVVCCVYSTRCGVSLRASALRLALPSSLVPVLVAVLPSTMGAVVYLSHSSGKSQGGGGDVVVLAVVGALLCAVPLGLLAWIAFVLPSRLGLVVKPGKSEVVGATSSNTLLSTLQLLHRSMSAEQWVWEAKESSANTDKQASLVAPERAGRIVLLEYRLLWFSVLDVALVAFISGLGVGSSFGGPSTCRASLIVVVVLLALETVLCAALKPFATLRSQVTVVVVLGCTTLSAVLQLATDPTNDEDALLLASAAVDLVVLGMSIARLLLVDAPEMLSVARDVLREISSPHPISQDTADISLSVVEVVVPPLAPPPPPLQLDDLAVDEGVEPEDTLADDAFWGADGCARVLHHTNNDDDQQRTNDDANSKDVGLAWDGEQSCNGAAASELLGLYEALPISRGLAEGRATEALQNLSHRNCN